MKKLQSLPFISLLFFIPFVSHAQGTSEPQLGKDPIPTIIKAMTLDEKVKFVAGMGMHFAGMRNNNNGPVVGQTQDKVPGAAGTTFAIPRLGIPSIVVSDGPAGVRIDSVRGEAPGKTFYATAWPVGTLLASSWDTALVQQVGASSFDTPSTSWITESGKYTVKIGASSADIRLSGTLDVPSDIVVEKDHKVLAPKGAIDELKR